MDILTVVLAVLLLLANKYAHPQEPFLKFYAFMMFIVLPLLLLYFATREDIKKLVGKLSNFRKRKKKHIVEVSPARGKRKKRRITKYAPFWMKSTDKAGRGVLKELGIGYEKVKKEKPKKRIVLSYRAREDKTEEILRAKWQPYIEVLEEKGEVYVSRNHHYGKLRGKDILRAMYRDLRRLGYDVELEMDDYDGKIKLKK